MKVTKMVAVSVIMAILSGCATTKNKFVVISPEDETAIHSIAVAENVKAPAELYYMGPGVGYATLLAGPLGTVISAKMSEKVGEKLQAVVDNNNIHIAKIVRDEVVKDVQAGPYKLHPHAIPDAVLHINVKAYGFSIHQGYSIKVRPILTVEGTLIRGGRIVWQEQTEVNALRGDMPEYSEGDLEKNPMLINEAWSLSTQEAVKQLVAQLV